MAVQSAMIPLGSVAPDFTLLDTVSNKQLSLSELRSDLATVIMFLCNHCPYVKHIQPRLVDVANLYQTQGVKFIAISSNDIVSHPEDGPDLMRLEALQNHYPFPYLYDSSQSIAKAYDAACTPDFYIFDRDLRCVYRGRFDDSTPRNHNPVTGSDLSHALDNILAGTPVSLDQKSSIGCSIKWKETL